MIFILVLAEERNCERKTKKRRRLKSLFRLSKSLQLKNQMIVVTVAEAIEEEDVATDEMVVAKLTGSPTLVSTQMIVVPFPHYNFK